MSTSRRRRVRLLALLPALSVPLVGPSTAALAGPVEGHSAQVASKHASGLVTALRAAVENAAPSGRAQGAKVTPAIAVANSTPSGITVTGSSAVIRIGATSTAPYVEFLVDGNAVGAPTAVSVGTGQAALDFATWGYSNGTHVVSAADCADTSPTNCDAQAAASTSVNIQNNVPSVTSPAYGSTVTGGFTITALSSGGGVAFLVDGIRRGFDPTSPYSFAYTGSALSAGSHSLSVAQCSTDGTRCGGPQSSSVWITSNSLHPTITSLSPGYFSPNGDGVRDETTVTFSLPDQEDVSVSVETTGGQLIRGPVPLGSMSAGSHQWVWHGGTTSGAIAPQGSYYLVLDTSRTISGALVRGEVKRSLFVDLAAPQITAGTGDSSIYPVVDGYHDYASFGWILNERATSTLRIADSSGRIVRTITEVEEPGRHWMQWWGHDDQSRPVAAGTYRWWVSATDTAGNPARGGDHYFTVSLRHLVSRTTYIYRNADSFTDAGGSDPTCAAASTSDSWYAHGVWLYNGCWGGEIAAAFYRISLPSAVQYTHIGLSVLGSTDMPPGEMGVGFGVGGGESDYGFGGPVVLNTYNEGWYYLGGVGSGYVRSDHTVFVAPYLDDAQAPCDFDMAQLRLGVTYQVLQ